MPAFRTLSFAHRKLSTPVLEGSNIGSSVISTHPLASAQVHLLRPTRLLIPLNCWSAMFLRNRAQLDYGLHGWIRLREGAGTMGAAYRRTDGVLAYEAYYRRIGETKGTEIPEDHGTSTKSS